MFSTDIPPQLIKEERRLLDRIAELEQQLAEPTVPGGPGSRRDGIESTPEQLQKDNLKERARQNVIFELGFFIGMLGRHRVCALYKGGVELPSDLSGVLWIPMDTNGAWRLTLAREMKTAGLNIDLNKLT